MNYKKIAFSITFLLISFFMVTGLNAAALTANQQGAGLTAYQQDGTLAGAPAYDWWYGCSPTSAGMMMGYYDRNGYNGETYNNLVPGGVAGLNFSSQGLTNNIIASQNHIDAYYKNGYGGSGDDIARVGAFDSLADFMGTSQDAYNNTNGSTTFWTYNDGSRLSGQNIFNLGSNYYNDSGMYGIWEYLNYAGYTIDKTDIYNQQTDNLGLTYGFSFNDYKAEIDAGRVVMIQVEGHSMFGYGYDDSGNVIFHDTWNEIEHSMAWGGSYSGMSMWGVTCFELGDGDPTPPVPEPGTMLLFGFGLLGSAFAARRKNS